MTATQLACVSEWSSWLCVGESPRDRPWKQIGMRVSLKPFSGEWARSNNGGETWHYTGVVLPVSNDDLPAFARTQLADGTPLSDGDKRG